MSFPRSGNRHLAPLASISLLLALAGCGTQESTDPAEVEVVQTEATRTMVRELDRLYRETLAHPLAYYYMNLAHAAMIREQAASQGEAMPPSMRQAYAAALLNGGDTEAAIEQLERLRDDLGDAALMTRAGKDLLERLGIAYLRLGEQQNCIANHTAASCILPLRPEALHRLPTGSQQALGIYSELLERYRTDYASRWLLNVAHMTLGTYPEGVPPGLLIPNLEADPNAALPRFPNIAGALGVDVDNLSGGVSVEDFNGDGLLDIFTTAFRLNDRIRLFLNDGRGGFVDRSEAAGLAGLSGGLNVLHADYDNDGDADVLVLRGGWLGEAGQHPNSLLKNNGDPGSGLPRAESRGPEQAPTFQDVTVAAGLYALHPTQTAAWADYDLDGRLDLFIGNEESDRWLRAWQSASAPQPLVDRPHPSRLYRNNGDGSFTEVAAEVGIDLDAFVKGVAWGDVNNDGLPDLYASVIGSPNRLYLNRGAQGDGGWRFEEVAAGVHEPFFSFPTWFFDYDNDGWEDLFVGPFDLRRINDIAGDAAREYLGLPVEAERPRLFRNNGDETFTDVTEAAGLDRVLFAMGANYGDLDNDGYLDFYIGTGAPDLRSIVPNRMFRNRDGERFDEVTFEGGFGHLQKGHGVAFADFDQDGDQDIYTSIGGAFEGDVFRNALFENPGPPPANAWVTLRLEGVRSNRSAIGARIQITVTDPDGTPRSIHRTVSTGGSFGASSLQQEIGLGPAARIDELRITWPNRERTVDVFSNLPVNHTYRVVEGQTEIERVPTATIPFRKEATSTSPPGRR